jgi:hypothetical protein
MLNADFNRDVDRWMEDLEQKTFTEICTKPSPASWSLGQVCMHLIEATHYYLEEINICLSGNDHIGEEMSMNAKTMFRNKAFPDELIEGPPSNSNTPQPESKEILIRSLMKLRDKINAAAILISTSANKGKTKHPGLHYFNATEWFQFAEMHFRHHARQKKRIDEFLKNRK